MNNRVIKINRRRTKRSLRVRKNIHGTASCPRLCVFKSNKHISVQLVDDDVGYVLGSISTHSKEFANTEYAKRNKASGRVIGTRIAEIATAKGIEKVVFDRGPYKYHGILAELATAARERGLQF